MSPDGDFYRLFAFCRICGKTLTDKDVAKGRKHCKRCRRAKSKQKLGRVS